MRITRRSFTQGAAAMVGAFAFDPLRAASAGAPVVETAIGKVRGARSGGVSAFKGIPFGADTAARRFQPPGPAASWSRVRDCLEWGLRAPQGSTGSGRIQPGADMAFITAVGAAVRENQVTEGPEGEDCLVLNVWTPDASAMAKRPVMVWLHGGGFAIGAGGEPVYDGSALVRRGDVVVVTINHRLAAPGYLYLGGLHDDFADSGMAGQLDQVLALEWVRDNIAAFGGDPGNVTIFGESGGGAKVSVLLAMPAARGLFHKAIIQSGPGVRMVDRDDAALFADRVLAELGIAPSDVHKVQGLDIAAITRAANAALASAPPGQRTLSPVVDGRSLPRHPFDPDAPPTSAGIPLMIGTCKDEATLFSMGDPLFGKMTEADARDRFDRALGDRAAAAFAFYKALRPDDAPTYWVTSMATDRGTWIDSIRIAERQAAIGAPVHMFRLDWHTPVFDGVFRAPHGIDTALVFDNADKATGYLGTGPEPAALGAKMSQAWINFARTGDPSQDGLPWPAYDSGERQTLIFDNDSRIVGDPDRTVREFWA